MWKSGNIYIREREILTRAKMVKLGVFSDTHVGCTVPKSIGEVRRQAFQQAFSKAIDGFIAEQVDYVIHGGDLFERRTMSSKDSVFVKNELQRLVNSLKKVKIFIVRGNHDGTPDHNMLDYVKHPLAGYFIVLGEKALKGEPEIYDDGVLAVQGVGYTAYPVAKLEIIRERIKKQFSSSNAKYKLFLVHAFFERERGVLPYVPTHQVLTTKDLTGLGFDIVICGHQHKTTPLQKIDGFYVLVPGATESVELSDETTHGYYIISLNNKIRAEFKPISPFHRLKNLKISGELSPHNEEWYIQKGEKQIETCLDKCASEKLILRCVLSGTLEGDKYIVEENIYHFLKQMQEKNPKLIYFEVENKLETPVSLMELPEIKKEKIYPKLFEGLSAKQIREAVSLTEEIESLLEERGSSVTGLLTDFQRRRMIKKWKEILEAEQ